MSRYKIRTVRYEPTDIDESQVIGVTEAARILGLTKPGLINAILRGELTEILDTEAVGYQRRLLRAEVEALAKQRAEGTHAAGGDQRGYGEWWGKGGSGARAAEQDLEGV